MNTALYRLKQWMEREFVEGLKLSGREAAEVARACSSWNGTASASQAATVVAIARAVKCLPSAREWLVQHEEEARSRLVRGDPDPIEMWIGEATAPPAPDVIDFNWPEFKVFGAVDIPEGLSVGDEFLIGDGMGARAWAVSERDGKVGVVVTRRVETPLEELLDAAWTEAENLIDR